MTEVSIRHAELAARFATIADGVIDWEAPTPVPEWRARDVVTHLVTWLPGFLAGLGVGMDPAAGDDPVSLWRAHSAAVQAILDDPELAGRVVASPMGPRRLDETLDTFYLADVFMHRWDLARASGQDPEWDPATAAAMFEGMAPMRDVLAGSGQYGTPVILDDSHRPEDRLAALIGRDPAWRPGS